MNAFNRLVMMVIALILIGVPVFLLLVGYRILPEEQVDAFVGGCRYVLNALGGLSVSSIDPRAQLIAGIIGVLVSLVSLLLLLRELTFGRPVARKAFVDDTPGRETAVTTQAVRRLAEGAAREVGAVSPTCYLDSEKNRYNVSCNIWVRRSQGFGELATRSHQNIRRVLEEQQVPIADIEVMVQGIAP